VRLERCAFIAAAHLALSPSAGHHVDRAWAMRCRREMKRLLSVVCLSLLALIVARPVLHAASAEARPVTPQASPEAQALLATLYATSGQSTLTGQHNYPNTESKSEFMNSPRITTAHRSEDRASLLIDSTVSFGENKMSMNDSWRLTDNGKPLLIQRSITSPRGKQVTTLVFDRP
jgi:hypothetical protein